jgi:hypothetical protein
LSKAFASWSQVAGFFILTAPQIQERKQKSSTTLARQLLEIEEGLYENRS